MAIEKDVLSTGTRQIVTRGMVRSNAPRVTWSKNGQKIEIPVNNTRPALPGNQSGVPVDRCVEKMDNVIPTSTRITKTAPRSMTKAANVARKTTDAPSARLKKVGGRSAKDSTLSVPRRQSFRLAGRLAKPIIATPARITSLPASVPSAPETAVEPPESERLSNPRTPHPPAREQHASHNDASVSRNSGPSDLIYEIESNNQSPTIQTAVQLGTEAGEPPADEETMEQYMLRVNNRIDALEHRELLRAAIAAPFWWDELSRDLQKQVVRLSIAISSGRVQDFNEMLEYPIEHSFWTEEVRYNMDVSKAA
jgi:hypothetical protein